MNLLIERSPQDSLVHAQNISLITGANTANNTTDWQLYCNTWAQPQDLYQWIAPTENNPAIGIMYNNAIGQLLVVAGGMDSAWSQAPAILRSWGDRSPLSTVWNVFAYAAAVIQRTVGFIPPNYLTLARFVGHSMGGAVVSYLPAIYRPCLTSSADAKVYTYGAPKPWPVNQYPGIGGYDWRRAFLNSDPVPALPPGSGEFGALWTYVGVPAARQYNRWEQACQGLTFDGNGNLVQSARPLASATPTTLTLSLLAWLTGLQAFGSASHPLSQYSTACNALTLLPVASSRGGLNERPTTPIPVTTTQLEIQEGEQLAILANNIAANPTGAANGIQSGVPLVNGVRFRGISVGGRQWVYYGDAPVVPTATLRTRRAIVRQLNRGLK